MGFRGPDYSVQSWHRHKIKVHSQNKEVGFLGSNSGVKSHSALSCIEHDRLPFSDILGVPRVLSAPQLMFYLLPLAPRILKSGETYLKVDL